MSDFFRPINLVSLAVGICGLIWGIYTYAVSRQTVTISFISRTGTVFNDISGRFKLSDAKSGVDEATAHLSRTRFVFWNSGNAPLSVSDLRQPLAISASSGVRIVVAELISSSPELAKFELQQESNSLKIQWVYFDPGFSVVVDVYHTGSDAGVVPSISYVSGRNILTNGVKESVFGQIVVLLCFTGVLLVGSLAIVLIFRRFLVSKSIPRAPIVMLLFFTLWWGLIFVPKLFGFDAASVIGFFAGNQQEVLSSRYLKDLGSN